jgi:rod shape-determining protein MreC
VDGPAFDALGRTGRRGKAVTMFAPRGGWSRFTVGLRALADRLALASLVGLSVLLLLLGKADMRLANAVAGRLGDAAAPVLWLLNQPIAATRAGIDRVGELLALNEENARLREENRRLLAWQAEATKLTVQNRALRRMLNMPTVEDAAAWTTARVVADSGGGFVHTVLLDAGAEQGIAAGMAAATPQGLAGRVVAAGRRSSRVLLITDFNSRIPVLVERSGDQAILEGDNGARPALRFLPINPGFQPGDRVVTSGQDGLLPPGLPVGEVAPLADGKTTVRPYVDWARLDYLSLLRYEGVPAGLADPRPPTPRDRLPDREGPAS